MEKYKNNIGKILFIVSVILCIYMVFSQLTHLLFEIDEYFTYALIKFPLNNIITITANDVHPPLYYIFLKIIIKILDISKIQYNLLYVLKFISIIPYMIILVISGIKIRKEYNWLTSGLFVFTLITLSEFFYNYLTIRMYSWAILFLLLSFIYLKEVFNNSNKSWILFTLFTALGAYTHYFVAISSSLIYILLLIHIFVKKDKSDFKKWILSGISVVILYMPWITSLISQLEHVHENYWIPQIDLNYFVNCMTSIAINNSDFTINNIQNLPIEILTIFTIILIIILAFKEYKSNSDSENFYIIMGLSLFIFTLLLGIILSFTFRPIIRVRYLIPAIGVFWFATAILIGKLKNKKLLIISLTSILLLSGFCFMGTINSSFELINNGVYEEHLLKDLKNDPNNLIITTNWGLFQFGTYINESKVYTDVDGCFGLTHRQLHNLFDYTLVSTDKFKKIVNKNSNKTIYIIEPNWDKIELGENTTRKEIHHIPNSGFTIYSINL